MVRPDAHPGSSVEPTIRWSEVAVVAVVTLAAFLLRAWAISRVGIGQYDEGVYALSGLGIADPSQPHRMWQSQVQFSPPVYFLLVALSYVLRGSPSDVGAVAVNVVLGTALVPVVWWAARQWFGAHVGVVAAVLTALSQFQILMSRSALTDTAFTVFFTVALVALVAAMEKGGTARAVLAGLATAVAWNTKYHGWFVLLIGAGAWIGWTWLGGATGEDRRRAARAWVVATAVAGMCYLPWSVIIQASAGGTVAWSDHYAHMLSRHWIGNVERHLALQAVLDGPWTRASLPLSLLALMAVSGRVLRRSLLIQIVAVAALGVLGLAVGGSAGMMLLALAALPVLWRERGRFAAWVAVAWAALWFVAAPMYRPYFRLLLPFAVVCAILAGVTLDRWMTARASPRRISRVGGLLAGAALVTVVFMLATRRETAMDPWRDNGGMRRATAAMLSVIPPHADVRVIWEPPVAYYLQLDGRNAFEDVDDITVLDTMSVSRYIVTGIYVRRTPELRAGMARHASELELLGRYPVQPTDIRLLDDFSVVTARQYREHPDSTYDLLVYRLRPHARAR